MSIALVCLFSFAQVPVYLDATAPIEARLDDLISRMTVEEKIAQLVSDGSAAVYEPALSTTGLGEISPTPLRGPAAKAAAELANRIQRRTEDSRLKIPVIFHDEALHGLLGNNATSFPQAIGLASTFNPELMGRVASQIARETKSRGIRHVLSPVVNVVRDARWGRVEETYGEDTYLQSVMGAAFVRGFEQQGVLTTPKHYVVNVWDGGRDSHSVHISERALREIYLPPFKACFDAGARTVMAAYNSVNGRPASASKWLLTDILRGEWGFQGFVVSDYGSLSGVYFAHQIGENEADAAAQALTAGMDMELPGRYFYGDPLRKAIQEGLVSKEVLDKAIRRILRAKFELGLFEARYVDPTEAEKVDQDPARKRLALAAAQEAIVLLTNPKKTLPLRKNLRKIAVLGPTATGPMRLGGYSGFGIETVSLLDGIKAVAGSAQVVSAPGASMGRGRAMPPIPASLLRPKGRTGSGLFAQYFAGRELQGQPIREGVELPEFDLGDDAPGGGVAADNYSIRYSGSLVPDRSGRFVFTVTSDDGVRLFLDGKKVLEDWSEHGPKTDEVSVELTANMPVEIVLEYFEAAGQAKLSFGMGATDLPDAQIDEAVNLAKGADVAVIGVGINEGEGGDRAFLDLPGNQEDLILKVAQTGVPTVVVLIAGAPVTMERWVDQVDAVVEGWYPGEQGGRALADVLFGEVNPSAKLPITFPRSVGQCPIYYNLEPSGRGYGYIDLTGKPRFAFGHGLSYTEFAYSNLQITPEKAGPSSEFSVKIDIENIGKRPGSEVVQLYLHDEHSSVTRPLMELKAFRKVTLRPGEKRTLNFTLGFAELKLLDINLHETVEPGTFEVMVGSASDDIRLRGKFLVENP